MDKRNVSYPQEHPEQLRRADAHKMEENLVLKAKMAGRDFR